MYFKTIIYFIIIYLVSYILVTNKILSSIFGILVPLLFLFSHYSKIFKLDTFQIVKGLSVLIPLIFYSNYHFFLNNMKKHEVIIFTFILFIIILEPAFMLEFFKYDLLSNINGIFLIILAFFTPKLLFNPVSLNIEFSNHIWWSLSSTIILNCLYLFNDYYRGINWRYSGIFSITVPTIHSLVVGNTNLWLPLRVFSLTLSFLITNFFENFDNYFTDQITKKIRWTSSNYNNINVIGNILGFISLIPVIYKGYDDTILDYIIKYLINIYK